MPSSYLQGATIIGSYLQGIDISKAQAYGIYIDDCIVFGSFLINLGFQAALIMNTDLKGSDMQYAHLEGTQFGNVNLEGVSMARVYFQERSNDIFSATEFHRCYRSKVDLTDWMYMTRLPNPKGQIERFKTYLEQFEDVPDEELKRFSCIPHVDRYRD